MTYLQDLSDGKERLEDQMVSWDQIQNTKDEVTTWLDTVVQKLEQNSTSFGDSGAVKTNLQKYRVSIDLNTLLIIDYVELSTNLIHINL